MSKQSIWVRALGAACVGGLAAQPAPAEPLRVDADAAGLSEVVITASRMRDPLRVEADAKAPRQPLPAHDGADYLKTVPGFAVIRKGGTDGDPVFRGMAASRVGVQVDGEQVLGGCGMRMDPPTAYVFPEAYDRIVVIKGPQTVLQGPGVSAASVSFERDPETWLQPDWRGRASLLAAAFGRRDAVMDLRAGTARVNGELTGTFAESGDYEDGAGARVHSSYQRWSVNGVLGWTPDDQTRVELTGVASDGEAAYADRGMDGVAFTRDNLGLRVARSDVSSWLPRLEAQAFYNHIDHVMDNFSLRDFTPSMMMPGRTVSNPDRTTTGARLTAEVRVREDLSGTIGLERLANRHRLRSTRNETTQPYRALAMLEDARFRSDSLYGEATWTMSPRARWSTGLRLDQWFARDSRSTLAVGMTQQPNPTAGLVRDATLTSGFLRHERDLDGRRWTAFAGAGYVERFPDYWELVAAGRESAGSLSAYLTRPERTLQVDAGLLHRSARLEWSVSLFASTVDDFILVQNGYAKGLRQASIVRNVDARTLGGELDAQLDLGAGWRLTGTLAHTRGDNRTDRRPLAQVAPFEARLGLEHERENWTGGALLRLVDAQDRVAVGQGNIVGQDIGATQGFAVLSLHSRWKWRDAAVVSFGIDNVFDAIYAEHLSRSGAMVAGFEQTTRVSEPGRTAWLKLSFDRR
jgi:iron complex outermembrane recepter protein